MRPLACPWCSSRLVLPADALIVTMNDEKDDFYITEWKCEGCNCSFYTRTEEK